MRSVRVGVVGCGWFGAAHARVYRAAGADLVAVADVDGERAKRLGEVYRANYYSDYRRMLDLEDLDAVSVVVTPQNLAEVAVDAMERGISVLIEKPMAVSREQLEKLMKTYHNSGVIAMPGFIELFNPGYGKLREIVESGAVGEVLMISGTRLGRFPKRSLAWKIGVALDLAIHEVYIQMHLLGAPRRVRAFIRRPRRQGGEDIALYILSFDEAVGLVEANWLTPAGLRVARVSGTSGSVWLDYLEQRVVLERLDSSVIPRVPRREPLLQEITHFIDLSLIHI